MKKRSARQRRKSLRRSGESGNAMAEFGISIPLFVFVIWGLVTLVSVARSTLQVAMVAHAVVREAAGGLGDDGKLQAFARAYGRAIGMSDANAGTLRVSVTGAPIPGVDSSSFLGSLIAALPLPKRVTVRASVHVPDSMKLLTGPVEMVLTNDCLLDTWKNPWIRLLEMFHIPVPFKGK